MSADAELWAELRDIARVYLGSAPEQMRARVGTALEVADARDVRGVVGWLFGVLGGLEYTVGRREEAERYLGAAVALAEERGDGDLRVWILSEQALIADYDGEPERVLALAEEGVAATSRPTFATVRLLALAARARAALRDRTAAEAALGRARMALAELPVEQRGGGLFAYPEEKLASAEGDVWLRLGDPERALQALDRARQGYDGRDGERRSVIDRALVRLKIAAAHAAAGRPGVAAQLGEEALQLDGATSFASVRARARALGDVLGPHRDLPAVKRLLAQFTQ